MVITKIWDLCIFTEENIKSLSPLNTLTQPIFLKRVKEFKNRCLRPEASVAKSTNEPNGYPRRRWCILDMIVHKCAYRACIKSWKELGLKLLESHHSTSDTVYKGRKSLGGLKLHHLQDNLTINNTLCCFSQHHRDNYNTKQKILFQLHWLFSMSKQT
jgi:hypothetical protein